MDRFVLLLIAVLSSSLLTSCIGGLTKNSNFREWEEEVKLNDGRVILVTQKKKCEGAYTGQDHAECIDREAWLTINLPEFSSSPILWHENLRPTVLNISKGQLYLVAKFPTQREFRLYGQPSPPYICFILQQGLWRKIPFNELPLDIYDVNMLIEGIPPKNIKYLSVTQKESRLFNGDIRYRKWQKHIDPKHTW